MSFSNKFVNQLQITIYGKLDLLRKGRIRLPPELFSDWGHFSPQMMSLPHPSIVQLSIFLYRLHSCLCSQISNQGDLTTDHSCIRHYVSAYDTILKNNKYKIA